MLISDTKEFQQAVDAIAGFNSKDGRPQKKTYVDRLTSLPMVGFGYVVAPDRPVEVPLSYDRAWGLIRKELWESCNQLRSDLGAVEPVNQLVALAMLHRTVKTGQCEHENREEFWSSTLVRLYREKAYQLAVAEFPKWAYYRGRLQAQFVKQREFEARMFAGG